MKLDYSLSVNNWFKDFPRTFKMTCGPEIGELGGPWVEGSKLILAQTPNSKIHYGVYQEGCHLPEYRIIYTDTGLDNDFKIKYVEYGWGTFVKTNDPNYSLQIEKFCEIHSGYNGIVKLFTKTGIVYTRIPKETAVYGPQNPDYEPIVDPDPETGYGSYIQFDLNLYTPYIGIAGVINFYGKYAEPPLIYIPGATISATWLQIATQTDILNRYADLSQPNYDCYWFAGVQGVGYPFALESYLYRAPDRNGLYHVFQKMYWGITDYLGVEPQYAFFISDIYYNGEEVTDRIRQSRINAPSNL
jgi:hypothetical protein